MQIEKKHIGDLFKSGLENYQIEPEEIEWIELKSKLQTKKFFRFSYKKFNVYYSGLIAASFVATVLLTYRTFQGETLKDNLIQPEIQDEMIVPNKDSINNDGTTGLEYPQPKTSETPINEKVDKSKPSTDISKALTTPAASEIIKADSIKKPEEVKVAEITQPSSSPIAENTITSQPIAEVKKEKKPKKIVYVTKQDTIVVVDTLTKKSPLSKRRR